MHLDVSCGINFKTLRVQNLAAVFFLYVATDLLGIIWDLLNVQISARLNLHLRVNGLAGLALGNISLGNHTVENIDLPLLGSFRMPKRRVFAGSLGQACQDGAFSQIEL